jgi:hypothetical protein
MVKIYQGYSVNVHGENVKCKISLTYDFTAGDEGQSFRICDCGWDMEGSQTESFKDAIDVFINAKKILLENGLDCFKGTVYLQQINTIVCEKEDIEEHLENSGITSIDIMSKEISTY